MIRTLVMVLAAILGLVGAGSFARGEGATTGPVEMVVAVEGGVASPPGIAKRGVEFGEVMVRVLAVVASAVVVFVGVVFAVVAMAALGGLVGVGVLSLSVLVGLVRKSVRSGFKALFLQAGALVGIPFGIGAVWLGEYVLSLGWSTVWVVSVGACAGALAGIAVGSVFNLAWGQVLDAVRRRNSSRQ